MAGEKGEKAFRCICRYCSMKLHLFFFIFFDFQATSMSTIFLSEFQLAPLLFRRKKIIQFPTYLIVFLLSPFLTFFLFFHFRQAFPSVPLVVSQFEWKYKRSEQHAKAIRGDMQTRSAEIEARARIHPCSRGRGMWWPFYVSRFPLKYINTQHIYIHVYVQPRYMRRWDSTHSPVSWIHRLFLPNERSNILFQRST